MKRLRDNIVLLISFMLPALFLSPLSAQKVSFGLYTNADLILTPHVPDELDFGTRISGSGEAQILLGDDETVVIQIDGVAYLDVTVTLTPPSGDVLVLEGDLDYINDPVRSLPVDVVMAYYNRGQENIPVAQAKAEAVTVVGNTATFQIRRRPGGPPGPPPTPPHAGYTPPQATAYLFIFGTLNVGEVNAGPYSGIIDIHVEYSTYQ